MRTIGLDVHKRFAEVAILEAGQPLRRRRIKTTPEELRSFAAAAAVQRATQPAADGAPAGKIV